MTEARAQLPTLLDEVRRGRWQLIGRRGRPEAVVADVAEVETLLATAYRFSPEVVIEEHEVGIYISELETHATGGTLDEALADLAEIMLEYAADWEDHLRAALNHRPRAGYVRRIQLAGDVSGVLAMLSRDAEAVLDDRQAPDA
jgi:prevent-host-death family protein